MSTSPYDRRQVYDLDYFADGGIERRGRIWKLSPSIHKFGDESIPSGLSTEGALESIFADSIRHRICDSKY
jgi:hypothetical protein